MAHIHSEASVMFENKEYDVTNYIEAACGCCCTCGIAGCAKKTLVLDNEEAILTIKDNCTNNTQKRPYAQLGSVESQNNCGCCWSVKTDLVGVEGAAISPGFGCDEMLVKELIDELQKRKVGRGNIAQIKHAENLAKHVEELKIQMALILDHLNIQYPPTQETMDRLFPQNKPHLSVGGTSTVPPTVVGAPVQKTM